MTANELARERWPARVRTGWTNDLEVRFEDLFLSTVERYVEDGLDMRMETVVTDIEQPGDAAQRSSTLGKDDAR